MGRFCGSTPDQSFWDGLLTTFASRSLEQSESPLQIGYPAFNGLAKAKRQSVFHRNLGGARGGIDSHHPVHLRKWLWSKKNQSHSSILWSGRREVQGLASQTLVSLRAIGPCVLRWKTLVRFLSSAPCRVRIPALGKKKARYRIGNGLLRFCGAPFAKIVEPRYWRSVAPCSSGFPGPPKIATTEKGEAPRGASPFLLSSPPPRLGRGRSRSGSPARSPWPASGSPCRTWRRCPRACRRS